jgi:two-component system chemotaxis response regulator CheB
MAIEREFLLPGDYRATRKPKIYATLLGSCVSVCLRNRDTGYAAMNHYMLDTAPPAGTDDKGRYGNLSTKAIVDVLMRTDPRPSHYTAKLYGGAAVVSHLGSGTHIGSRNVESAREVLKTAGIRIVDEDVGGKTGRRINFNTATGEVDVRLVKKTEEAARLEARRRDIAGRDPRLLIVDDSQVVRSLIRKAVETAGGFEIVGEAADSYQARELVLSRDPDVVCLDIIMPGLNGLQFLKKLQEHFPLPVVICSTIAKAGSDIARRAREYGAVDVVDKEELKLYEGMDTVVKYLVPKLRNAVGKVRKKDIFQKA